MGYSKDQLLSRLQELKIEFTLYDNSASSTVEDQANYVGHSGGGLSKNLLLKDKEHRLYIVSAPAGTKFDLEVLSQRLGLGKGGLQMASEEALHEVLQVPIGCVTPFALINESASMVSLLLDQGFKAQEFCYFHPLTNEVTIALSASGLNKFLTSIGRQPSYVDLEDSPLVGKDNPPDLAFLVPTGAPIVSHSVDSVTPTDVSDANNVPKEKSAYATGESSEQTEITICAIEKPESKADAPAESKGDAPDESDVEKFVHEVVERISPMFLSEISKYSSFESQELSESSILDGVKQRVTSDLESMALILKNAAFTEGFHAGLETVHYEKPS